MDDEGFDIPNCVALKKTPKALVVQTPKGGEMVVPDSQIHDDSEVYREGDTGKLIVSTWWAEKNKLI